MRALCLLLVGVLGCAGNAPGAKTADAAFGWDGHGPFTFSATDFHFELGGTQILQVDDSGRVRDLFLELQGTQTNDEIARSWRLARFSLAVPEQATLRKLLVAARLASLERFAQGARYPDGTTTSWVLRTPTQFDAVTRYEMAPPAELAPVMRFLDACKAAHGEARARAAPVQPEERLEMERKASTQR